MEENKLIQNKKDKTLLYIVAGLSAILVLLFIFFMVEKTKNKKHIEAIQVEKELLETELTELSHKYDDLKTANDTLNEKLDMEQEKIATLLQEMRTFRNNSYAEINKYKKEVGTLYDVLRSYVVQIDSLNRLNQKLLAENTQVKQQSDFLRERNQNLENQQKNMQEVIKLASALTAENFNVVPINKNGKDVNWKRCFQLRADFVVPRNITTKRGSRTVYLRIKRPDDKIIAFSEKSFFKYQNVSLTYSAKRDIEYEGERIEASIYWPNDGSLIPGKYVAELFCDNENIGTTEFFLK